jgi:hypothetical protein
VLRVQRSGGRRTESVCKREKRFRSSGLPLRHRGGAGPAGISFRDRGWRLKLSRGRAAQGWDSQRVSRKGSFPHCRDAPWGVSGAATSAVFSRMLRGHTVDNWIVLSASETPHGASLQWIVDGMPLSRHPLRECLESSLPPPGDECRAFRQPAGRQELARRRKPRGRKHFDPSIAPPGATGIHPCTRCAWPTMRSRPSGPRSPPSRPRSEPSGPRSEPSRPGSEPSRPRSEPSGPRSGPSRPRSGRSGPGSGPSGPRSESTRPRSPSSGPRSTPSRPRSEPGPQS